MRSLCFNTSKTPSHFINDIQNPSSSSPSSSFIERSIARAEPLIMKWDAESSAFARVTSLFYEDKTEAMEFINRVNNLQQSMHLFVLSNHYSKEQFMIRAQTLMQIAMKRLQKELYQILSTNRAYLDPESVSTHSSTHASARSSISDNDGERSSSEDEIRVAGDTISELERASILAMDNLKAIAECMISSGYGKECFVVYTMIRKSIIDEGVYKLGVEKLTMNQINKMDWEVQHMKIKNWLEAVKIAMNSLFTGEKLICDHVFASSESLRESCFAEISKEGATLLFGFPENISKCKKSFSREKIFRTLDMYKSISEQWTEIESIFSSESSSIVRSQAYKSLTKLADLVRIMLIEFESALQNESSKSPTIGGGIHHLTSEVMNYISVLADYANVLTDIIISPPVKTDLPVSYFDKSDSDDSAPTSALTVHISWLTLILLCKLDGKSKHYKQDVSLSYLFLANNLQYIVSKVRRSNLKYVLGDQWISKQEIKIKQFASNYERLGWNNVFTSLPHNPTAAMSPAKANHYFKQFNSTFEETRRRQGSYIVPDAKLRDEIRISIARQILAVYLEFYNAHRLYLGSEMNTRLFVRFAPEDVSNCLSDLFYGTGESVSVASVSSSPANRRILR